MSVLFALIAVCSLALQSVFSLQSMIDAVDTGGSVTITLSKVHVLDAPLVISSKRHVRLVGNGTLQGPDEMTRSTQWTLIRVEDGKLTIDEEVTVFGQGTTLGCVDVASGATFELVGASKITGCSSVKAGAAISVTGRSEIRVFGQSVITQSDSDADGGCIAADDESLVQVGDTATIAECRAVGNGGGVAVSQGSRMVMHDDAQLRHNTAALGGAVSLRFATLELFDQAQLLENQAHVNGGGVDVQQYSKLVLHDKSLVVRNHGGNWGGGVHAWVQSHIRCRGSSSISNNTAREGGGVFIAEYDVTFAESSTSLNLYDRATVAHNAATSGGGVYMRGWSTDLLATGRATILHNSATGGSGGGVYSNGGEILLRGHMVVGYNRAISGGGLFSTTEGGTINAGKNMTIVGNHAFGAGGGVQATSCVGAFLGTIRDNMAYKGGGLFFLGSLIELSGLIAANYAETRAGGVGRRAEYKFNLRQQKLHLNVVALDSSTTLTFLEGTSIVNNLAREDGGGLVLFDPSSTLNGATTVRFEGNVAEGSGGCLAVSALSALDVRGYEFRDCRAGNKGGAILIPRSASLTLEQVLIQNAFASRGAISIERGATLTAEACVVQNCIATERGGCAYAEDGASVEFRSTKFDSNTASDGGCVYIVGASFASQSSTFDGMTASRNGGVFQLTHGASISTLNDTFRGSVAAGGGGGLLFFEHATTPRPEAFEAALAQSISRVDGIKAAYGPFLATPLASIVLSHDLDVYEVGGTPKLIAPVEVRALDFLGQLVATATDTVEIYGNDGFKNGSFFDLDGETQLAFEEGFVSTRTLTIDGLPNTTVVLEAKVAASNLKSQVSVRLRPCLPGEVVASDQVRCVPCESYTYFDRGVCYPCKDGMDCQIGTPLEKRLIETIALEPGYWRANLASSTVERCYSSSNCPGGQGAGNDLCGDQASGVLCNTCGGGYYLSRTYKCRACAGTWPIVAVLLLCGFAAALLEFRAQRDHNGKSIVTLDKDALLTNSLSPKRSLKERMQWKGFSKLQSSRNMDPRWSLTRSGTNFEDQAEAAVRATKAAWFTKALLFVWLAFQTMAVFCRTEHIALSSPFRYFISASSVLTDLSEVTKCAEILDYFKGLFWSTMLPVIVGIVLAIAAAVRIGVLPWLNSTITRAKSHRVMNQHAQIWVYLMLLMHTPTCIHLNEFFDCNGPFESSNGDKVHLLHMDYRVSCSNARYRRWRPFASVMLCFYFLIVPGMFLGKLLSVRLVDLPSAIKQHRDGPLVVLTSSYREEFWYWGILDLSVRLACCGLLRRVIGRQSVRLGVTTFIAIAHLFVGSIFEPLGQSSLGRIYAMCNLNVALVIALGSITSLGADERKDAAGIVLTFTVSKSKLVYPSLFPESLVLTLSILLLFATIFYSARREPVFSMVADIVARRPFSKSVFQVLYQTKADTFLITAIDHVTGSFFNSNVVTNAELTFFEKYILPLEDHWNRQTLLAEILDSCFDVLRKRAADYLDDSEAKAAENTPWVDYVFGPLADNIRALSVQAGDNGLVERNRHIDQTILLAHVVKQPPLATYGDGVKLRAFDQTESVKASMREVAEMLEHEKIAFKAPQESVAQPALAPDSPLVTALQGLTSPPDLGNEFSTSVLSLALTRLASASFETFIQALLDRVPTALGVHDSVFVSPSCGEVNSDPLCKQREQCRSSKVRVLEEVEVSRRPGPGKCRDSGESDVTLLCARQQAVKSPSSFAKNIGDLVSTVDALSATFICKHTDALQTTYEALVAPSSYPDNSLCVVAVIDNLAAKKFPYDIKLIIRLHSPKIAFPFFCQVILMHNTLARQSSLYSHYDRLAKAEGIHLTSVLLC